MPAAYRVMNSWVTFFALGFFLTLPLWGPQMSTWEGMILPVTTKVDWVDVTPAADGVEFRFAYSKLRSCEFVNVVMEDAKGREVTLDLVDRLAPPPSTRLIGKQVSRLWHADIPTLDGVKLFFVHRCSPLWLTVTQGAP
jgi:hypothetical protein